MDGKDYGTQLQLYPKLTRTGVDPATIKNFPLEYIECKKLYATDQGNGMLVRSGKWTELNVSVLAMQRSATAPVLSRSHIPRARTVCSPRTETNSECAWPF